MDISSNDRSAMMPNYSFPDLVPEKASGSRLWDENGKEYIDFGGGIAVTSLGHCHPILMKSMEEQSKKLWHVSNYLLSKPAKELGQKIASKSFADKVLFSNSGNEANEAAIKLARKYFFERGDKEKYEILSFTNSFHGRSLANITLGDSEFHQTGFGPLPKGFIKAEFNNIEDVKKKISNKTAAIIVELIQGEAGVISAQNDFVEALRNICNENNILLIFDEVQSGIGRTGTLFAYQGYGVIPDILTLAKGLGGGLPIAATITTTDIAKCMQPGTHGSTFGGNPVSCAVASKLIDIVDDKKLLSGVMEKTIKFIDHLQNLSKKYDFFSDIRSAGLWIAADMKQTTSKEFLSRSYEEGLLLVSANGESTLRFAPSLIISDQEIEEGFSKLEKVTKSFC
jgi:predicted acetylornithine/succinylornithine family transaminase